MPTFFMEVGMNFDVAIAGLKEGQEIAYWAPLRKPKEGVFRILSINTNRIRILPASGKGGGRTIARKEYDRVSKLLPAVYTPQFVRDDLKSKNSSYIIAIKRILEVAK
jgi:hypothetical protein